MSMGGPGENDPASARLKGTGVACRSWRAKYDYGTGNRG